MSEVDVKYALENDHQSGVTYVYLPGHPRTFGCVARSIECEHGLILDLNARGDVIGIEHIWWGAAEAGAEAVRRYAPLLERLGAPGGTQEAKP